MSTLNITKTVQRSDLLYSYVQNSFPTLLDVSNDNTTLHFSFSDNQTANLSTLQTLLTNYVDPLQDKTDLSSSLSIFNSSSAVLAANGLFTGGWEDISVYATVQVLVLASTAGSIVLQFGVLNKQVDSSKTYSTTALQLLNVILQKQGRYFRIVYTNGATAQTASSIATYLTVGLGLAPGLAPPIGNLNDALLDTSTAALTRAVNTARYGIQQYGPLRINEQNELRVALSTTFQRLGTGNNYPVSQVSFVYNVNSDQNTTAVTGTGSVTWSAGRAVVNSGAAASSSATLSSYRYARCAAGDTLSMIFACAFTAGVAGNTQLCGGGTANNGLFIGYLGTSFGIMYRSAGVDTWVPQASFNSDTVNGSGKSGITLAPSLGNNYIITYDALGYGSCTFILVQPRGQIVMHTINFSPSTSLGIMNPQFPNTAVSTNITNTTNVPIYVASYSIWNDAFPHPKWLFRRSFDATKTFTTTSLVPLMCLYNKPTFNGQPNTGTLQLVAVSMNSVFTGTNLSHSNTSCIIAVIEFPVLTGAVYTDFNTSNSMIATSTTATAVSGGNVLYELCVQDGSAVAELTDHDLVLSPGSVFCVAVKLGVASSYLVSSVACFAEYQ